MRENILKSKQFSFWSCHIQCVVDIAGILKLTRMSGEVRGGRGEEGAAVPRVRWWWLVQGERGNLCFYHQHHNLSVIAPASAFDFSQFCTKLVQSRTTYFQSVSICFHLFPNSTSVGLSTSSVGRSGVE